MNIIAPKENNMVAELLVVCLTVAFIFALLFGYFSFDKKVRSIVKAELTLSYFLDEYVPTVEARFREAKDALEIIETAAPIYERRMSAIENWKERSCFAY